MTVGASSVVNMSSTE